MRIGVIGGTFDPIHNGHLAVAREVKSRLDLAEILFVLAGQPYLRVNSRVSPAKDRLEMVRLAIAGHSDFRLSIVDIDRPGPTYTIDTIDDLLTQLGTGAELFFVVGWENLAQLPRWREPSRLIEKCRLVAVPRPGYPRPDIKSLEAAISGISRRLIILDRPVVDISATDIRERVAQGLPISDLVPDAVAKYIREHRLYVRG